MDKNKIELGKEIGALVAGLGCAAVITNAVKFTTPSNTGRIGKILALIGGGILSNMIGDHASEYIDGKLDKLANRRRGGK